MKIAFACWDNRIAPVFDTAREICVVEAESGQIVGETQETLLEDLPVQKALQLAELGIGTLVCGAISGPMCGLVAAYGVQVIPFVAGDLREVIRAWLTGNLKRNAFAMPGCSGRGRSWRMWNMNKEVYAMNEKGRGGTGRAGGRGQGEGGQRQGGSGQGQGGGGQRRGRMGGARAAGAVGTCLCPQCGHLEPHERGVSCAERTCPKCGTVMTRQ